MSQAPGLAKFLGLNIIESEALPLSNYSLQANNDHSKHLSTVALDERNKKYTELLEFLNKLFNRKSWPLRICNEQEFTSSAVLWPTSFKVDNYLAKLNLINLAYNFYTYISISYLLNNEVQQEPFLEFSLIYM